MTITDFSKSKKTDLTISFMGFLSVIALSVSFWYAICTMISVAIDTYIIAMAVLFPTGIYILYSNKTFEKYSYFYVSMFIAICMFLRYDYFSNAILNYINIIADALNNENGLVIVPFVTSDNGNSLYISQAILVLFLSTVFSDGMRKKSGALTLVCTAAPLIAGMWLGLDVGLGAMILFLASMSVYMMLCLVDRREPLKNFSGTAIQLMVILAAFFVLFFTVFANYSGSELATRIRNSINEGIFSWRYDAESQVNPMPDGNLNEAAGLVVNEEVVFNITMQTPSAIYLRNYTGERFVDGKWETLPQKSYTGSYLGIIEWLSANDFYPLAQLSKIYAMDSTRTGSAVHSNTIRIENISETADKVFVPYEIILADSFEENIITDKIVESTGVFGEREYTFASYDTIYDYASYDMRALSYNLRNVDGYDEYLENEKIYRAFVYDNYLEIDKEYIGFIENLNIDGLKDKKLEDVIYEIRSRLLENYRYSETVEIDSGIDPFINFCENTKSGYEPHFATLSAMILRYLGFPTRYVEGYAVTAVEMAAYEEVTDMEFELFDTSAHAWVEVYIDTVGWVPIEVTPGYYILEVTEGSESTSSQQSFSVKDETYFFDQDDVYQTTSPITFLNGKSFVGFLILIAVMVMIVALALNRFVAWHRRRKIVSAEDAGASFYGLELAVKVLNFTDIKTEKSPYDAVTSLGVEYQDYLDLVYKEAYSKEGLTKDERKAVSEYAIKLIRQRYEESGLICRVRMFLRAYV